MHIALPVTALRRALILNWLVIAAAGLAAELARHLFNYGAAEPWMEMLSLSYEHNIPTWNSSCVLFLASLLLTLVGYRCREEQRRYVGHWWMLAAVFLYISLDEAVMLHEHMNDWFDIGGIWYFGWVIPAGVLVIVMGLSYLKFLIHLPKGIRTRFILAGVIYVTGALLMELPLGYWAERHGGNNLGYALIDSVEEALEILGASLFVYALVLHLKDLGTSPPVPKAAAAATLPHA